MWNACLLGSRCSVMLRELVNCMHVVTITSVLVLPACFAVSPRCKLFWPEHWAAFLDGNKLLGLATGVERREAKLIYCWSQALVTDELRRRQRAVSLTFWDFVEVRLCGASCGLGRVSIASIGRCSLAPCASIDPGGILLTAMSCLGCFPRCRLWPGLPT